MLQRSAASVLALWRCVTALQGRAGMLRQEFDERQPPEPPPLSPLQPLCFRSTGLGFPSRAGEGPQGPRMPVGHDVTHRLMRRTDPVRLNPCATLNP